MNYVGIMLNDRLYSGIPREKTNYERIQFYHEAGREYDVIPCFFRLQDIHLRQGTVLALVKTNRGYIKRRLPIPQVIHNRSIYQSEKLKQRLEQLTGQGITVFNEWNRYGKLTIHEILMKRIGIRPHLPCTVAATETSIKELMGMFPSLIIKPNSSSIGRGIIKLERADSDWRMTYPTSQSKKLKTIEFKNELPPLLLKIIHSKPYIVQQRLALATRDGRPFDCRVSVQRNMNGHWHVTGIAGKVAAVGKFVTNVAQGGTVYPLEKALMDYPQLHAQQVYNHLVHFSLKTAQQLSQHLPNLADIGLDVGITDHGFPVFIECNGRDLRYSFANAGMLEEWKATYRNPIGYARYLLDRR